MAKACSRTEIHINIQAHCVHHVKHQSKIQTREWRRGHGLRDWKERQRTSGTARGSGQRAEGRAHGHCSTSPNDSSRSPLSPRSWRRWTPVAELLPGRAQRPPCRWHRVCPDSRSVFTTSPSSRYAATRNLVTLPRGRLSSRIPTSAAVPHPFTDPSPCPALRSPLGQIRRANIASEKRHQTKRPRPPSSPTRIHQEADMWDGVKPRKPLLPAGQVVGVPRRRNTEANASEARDEENGGGQLQPRCHRAPHPERRYPRDMLGLELNSPRHR